MTVPPDALSAGRTGTHAGPPGAGAWLDLIARAHHVRATSRTASVALAIALLAWLLLLLGLAYAKFVVSEPPPNVVITFSAKSLTRLFAELVSLGLGCLGLLLAIFGMVRSARSRALALAAVANASVCTVCVALLM